MSDAFSLADLAARHVELREDMNRRFNDTNAHMERRFTELSQQMREMTFVPKTELLLELKIRDDRIETLESKLASLIERLTWRDRATVVSFIFPVLLLFLGLYFSFKPR